MILLLKDDKKREDKMDDYYIKQKPKLLKDFDKMSKQVKNVLVSHYGEEMADTIIQETRDEYENLIPEIPYIGGKNNPLTENLVKSAWFLALYRVFKRHGKTAPEAGEISYQMTEASLDAHPQFLLRLLGRWKFTPFYLKKLKKRALKSQKREYPGDWVFEVVDGDKKDFDFGVDYTECGICKFFQEQKAEEFTPFLCPLDIPMGEKFDLGLVRTKTLAEGNDKCDFRFKKGRKTMNR